MESLHLKTYLLYAIYIVRTSTAVLTAMVIIGLLNSISIVLPEGDTTYLLSSLTLIASILISPVIYAHFYERIEGKKHHLADLFRIYVPGYILLIVCIYIPIITGATFITVAIGLPTSMSHILLILLFLSLFLIYIIPCYFISGTIAYPIQYGLRFFFKNLFASAPLLLMALASELVLLTIHNQMVWLRDVSLPVFAALEFIGYIVASLIDFLLFIMLIYILRNQEDIVKREQPPGT